MRGGHAPPPLGQGVQVRGPGMGVNSLPSETDFRRAVGHRGLVFDQKNLFQRQRGLTGLGFGANFLLFVGGPACAGGLHGAPIRPSTTRTVFDNSIYYWLDFGWVSGVNKWSRLGSVGQGAGTDS